MPEDKNLNQDELCHWGIKGMRWGFRRYQNKDGSLTPEGKKRYDAELEKVKKKEEKLQNKLHVKQQMDALKARKQGIKDMKKRLKNGDVDEVNDDKNDTNVKKDISKMTNDEIKELTARQKVENELKRAEQDAKRIEADYWKGELDRLSNQSQLKEANKSGITKFLEKVTGKVVDAGVDVAINTGKKYVESKIDDKLGVGSEPDYNKMKKKYEALNTKVNYKRNRRNYNAGH